MKRAAIYARVSTEDQSDSGYSLPGQVAECRAYAGRIGASVVAELQEDASGAKPVTERLLGMRLFELVKRREVDAIIVHRVDRLSRDIVDLLITVRAWLKAGIEIHAGDVGKIESDNDITLIIKGWQGTDERKKIRERSMLGKRMKARAGKVVISRPPYGYRRTKDANGKNVNLEVIETEAEIIRLIFRWYVEGDESGRRLAIAAIARRLSEMRVITPGERAGYNRKRESGLWQFSTVSSILSHEVYAGTWYFGVRIGSTDQERPSDEWVSVDVPVIIGRPTWDAAQRQKQQNKEFSKRNGKHEYLLRGLVFCGECNSHFVGQFRNHARRYYACTWRYNHYEGLEARACRAGDVRADALEADVWNSVVSLFSDLGRFEQLLYKAQQEEFAALDPKRGELKAIEGMIITAEEEAGEIGQALRRASGIVSRTLEKNMEDTNRRYEALCRRRDLLLGEINQARLTDGAIQDALLFAEDVRAGIEDSDDQTKRRNLEMLKIQITIKNKRFYVTSLVGTWDGEIHKMPRSDKKTGSGEDGPNEDMIVNKWC